MRITNIYREGEKLLVILYDGKLKIKGKPCQKLVNDTRGGGTHMIRDPSGPERIRGSERQKVVSERIPFL